MSEGEIKNQQSNQVVMPGPWWFVSDFSREEIFILRTSFGQVKNHLEIVAVKAFTSLFDQHPSAFKVFIGRKVLPNSRDEVAYSWETKQVLETKSNFLYYFFVFNLFNFIIEIFSMVYGC